MNEEQRRTELAGVLRSRRERISPVQAGLPAAGRRRTPGLRREELAILAGVGTSWYTWLEQGRPITASAEVLDSLARVLQLTAEERTHLFILARREVPASSPPATEAVGASIRQMLAALAPYPAYVVNARWNVVAWNEAAGNVFIDFAALAPDDRNLLRLLFTDPTLRQRLVDWEGAAQHILALFRVSTAQDVGAAWRTELVGELACASAEFRVWWPRHDIAGVPQAGKIINHPAVGTLSLRPNPLQVGHAPDLWMLVYTPETETDTAAKLERLTRAARKP